MQKIIVWQDKHATLYFDASTKDKEENAMREMFKQMQEAQYYSLIEDDEDEFEIYQDALKGNFKSIKALLKRHNDLGCEYEEWHYDYVR